MIVSADVVSVVTRAGHTNIYHSHTQRALQCTVCVKRSSSNNVPIFSFLQLVLLLQLGVVVGGTVAVVVGVSGLPRPLARPAKLRLPPPALAAQLQAGLVHAETSQHMSSGHECHNVTTRSKLHSQHILVPVLVNVIRCKS